MNNIIINAWDPGQERGVSSYDVTHQLNANWIAEFPFGRGRSIGSDANGSLNALIGGWQLSRLFRWTSGFPVTVDNGYSNFSANFEQKGNANLIAPVKNGAYVIQSGPDAGNVNIFAKGPAASHSFALAYAGQSGQGPLRCAIQPVVLSFELGQRRQFRELFRPADGSAHHAVRPSL